MNHRREGGKPTAYLCRKPGTLSRFRVARAFEAKIATKRRASGAVVELVDKSCHLDGEMGRGEDQVAQSMESSRQKLRIGKRIGSDEVFARYRHGAEAFTPRRSSMTASSLDRISVWNGKQESNTQQREKLDS